MAFRLAHLVVRGEILNTRKNSVHGVLQLRGHECPLQIDLTGNCDPDLAGWHIRFEARPSPMLEPDESGGPPDDLSHFAWHQIGPTGTMTAARRVKIFDCSVKIFLIRAELNEPPPTRWVRCLYLEWYSQNGRVVVELPDPVIEFVERVALPGVAMNDKAQEAVGPPTEGAVALPEDDEEEGPMPEDENARLAGLEITTIHCNDDGGVDIQRQRFGPKGEEEEDVEGEIGRPREDAFGSAASDLQRHLDAEASATNRAAGIADDDVSEDIREMELLDDLIESDADEPLCSLFDKPMRLPAADDLDDRRAERVLKSVLAQLALFGIAVDICEHYSAREAYRLIVEKILLQERAYPQLRGTQWVTHFPTSNFCPTCEAESEREFQEQERRNLTPEAQRHRENKPRMDTDSH